MVFIDLEKIYDKILREIIWHVLNKKHIYKRHIDVIKDMCDGIITSLRIMGGETKTFPISIGLHHGSALGTYLFALVIVAITRHIQNNIPWCKLFMDDAVLVYETKTE